MIDTDKYEGHLTGGEDNQTWAWSNWMLKNTDAVAQYKATTALLNDAPLLLEEVKRLNDYIESIFDGGMCDIETYEEYKERIE
tara:strand:- start:217 stop:465 length:249 start_codon:yes stop_codon:yes gene_type:complete